MEPLPAVVPPRRAPLLAGLVAGDLLVDAAVSLHDVVTHNLGPGPGLGLLQEADGEDDEDQDDLEVGHDDGGDGVAVVTAHDGDVSGVEAGW